MDNYHYEPGDGPGRSLTICFPRSGKPTPERVDPGRPRRGCLGEEMLRRRQVTTKMGHGSNHGSTLAAETCRERPSKSPFAPRKLRNFRGAKGDFVTRNATQLNHAQPKMALHQAWGRLWCGHGHRIKGPRNRKKFNFGQSRARIPRWQVSGELNGRDKMERNGTKPGQNRDELRGNRDKTREKWDRIGTEYTHPHAKPTIPQGVSSHVFLPVCLLCSMAFGENLCTHWFGENSR